MTRSQRALWRKEATATALIGGQCLHCSRRAGPKEGRNRKKMILEMTEGEHLKRNPNKPIIELIRGGRESYLWVGNNTTGDMVCFATVGPNGLIRLANAIYQEFGKALGRK